MNLVLLATIFLISTTSTQQLPFENPTDDVSGTELLIGRNDTIKVPIDLLPVIGNNCQLALHIKVSSRTLSKANLSVRKSGAILFTIRDPNKNKEVTFKVSIKDKELGQKKILHEVCFDSCKNIKALDLRVTSNIPEEKLISIEAIKGTGTCEIYHQSSSLQIIALIISFITFAIFVGVIFRSRIQTWLKLLKQHSTYENEKCENIQRNTKTNNCKNPLLLENEIRKSSRLRWLSVILCALLFLNGLQMVVIGFRTKNKDLITQENTYCPAEPLLPSFQITVGTWLCLATVLRVAATMLCYYIFTEIYYPNNQNFTCGKSGYFMGHSLLLLFDFFNFGAVVYFSTVYIKMFSDTLKPEDVELSVDWDDLYCDIGLYFSALVGFVCLCVLVFSAIVMLVIHIITVFNIFIRFMRRKVAITNERESECLNAVAS